MGKWFYQEWWVSWTLWGLGWLYKDKRGWSYDELTITVGPLNFEFIRDRTR